MPGVRVMRGAEIPSDHHLLVMTMKLRLKKHATATRHHITHKIQCGIAQEQRSQGAVPAQAIQQVPTTARARG